MLICTGNGIDLRSEGITLTVAHVLLRAAEDLARAVEASSDLLSRGAMAFLHTLQLAADKSGHTHLPWNVLLSETLRLMSSSGQLRLPHVHACWSFLLQRHSVLMLIVRLRKKILELWQIVS